jgi:hypothetical protein
MSADKVLDAINFMSQFHLDMNDLIQIIKHILQEEGVITQSDLPLQVADTPQVFGNEAQIVLMRRILTIFENWNIQQSPMLDDLDLDLRNADQGPIFFEMVKILWGQFKKHWDEYIASHQSDSSQYSVESVDAGDIWSSESSESVDGSDDMAGSSEDDAMNSYPSVRRTSSLRHVTGFRERDMGTLLIHLKNLYA